MLQQQRVVGSTEPNLTGPRIEPQTSHSTSANLGENKTLAMGFQAVPLINLQENYDSNQCNHF